MLANPKLMCVWLVILESCFGNKTEEVIEELQKELKETREELKDTKSELKETKDSLTMLTQVIDSLKAEIDGMKNDPDISKPTCKFALQYISKSYQ